MCLPCLFLYNIPCCFYLLLDFCYKSTVELLLSFFYNFLQDFTMFNVKRFCLWIIVVPSEGIQTPFEFARYFYSFCSSIVLVFHAVSSNWKTNVENV
jgi:hypothetical protein